MTKPYKVEQIDEYPINPGQVIKVWRMTDGSIMKETVDDPRIYMPTPKSPTKIDPDWYFGFDRGTEPIPTKPPRPRPKTQAERNAELALTVPQASGDPNAVFADFPPCTIGWTEEQIKELSNESN